MSVTSSPGLEAASSAVWYLENGVGVRDKDDRLEVAAILVFALSKGNYGDFRREFVTHTRFDAPRAWQ